jgi:hypothetical protein
VLKAPKLIKAHGHSVTFKGLVLRDAAAGVTLTVQLKTGLGTF